MKKRAKKKVKEEKGRKEKREKAIHRDKEIFIMNGTHHDLCGIKKDSCEDII